MRLIECEFGVDAKQAIFDGEADVVLAEDIVGIFFFEDG